MRILYSHYDPDNYTPKEPDAKVFFSGMNIPMDTHEETILDMERLPDGATRITIGPRDHEQEAREQERRAQIWERTQEIMQQRKEA